MLNIKRDWNWGLKCASIGYVILVISFGIFGIIFKGSSNSVLDFFVNISSKIINSCVYVLAFYPLSSFVSLSPIFYKKNSNVTITHLPYSKKQLFLKGLPLWGISYLCIVFVAVVMSSIIHAEYVSFSFKEVFQFNIILTVSTIVFLLSTELQFISYIIFTFAKNIKWYITLIIAIILNTIMITLTFGSFHIFNVNMQNGANYLYLLILLFFTFSAIIFFMAWRYIEKMYK